MVKLTTSRVSYFDQVSWEPNKTCRFFTNSDFFGQSGKYLITLYIINLGKNDITILLFTIYFVFFFVAWKKKRKTTVPFKNEIYTVCINKPGKQGCLFDFINLEQWRLQLHGILVKLFYTLYVRSRYLPKSVLNHKSGTP